MNRFLHSLLFVCALIFSCSPVFAQWQRQYPMEKLENVLNITTYSDGYGYAAGDGDLILKLDPTLQIWNPISGLDMNRTFKAVDYVAGTNGAVVAAGGQGLILSTNGGMNWMEIADAPANIVDLRITSAADILVVAVGGVFNWANNAWTDLGLPISSGVKDGFILDSDHIWVYSQGATPTIYNTSNGGNNWSMNTEIPSPDVVRFYDDQYGVAIDGRKVYHSTNGGNAWTEISANEIHNNSQDFAFGASPGVMLSATNNGEPSITQDSGKTWTKFDMGTINTKNYSVASLGDATFYVGNDVSSITHTMDSGLTWTETSGPKRSILYDTYFINRNTGFSVGSLGTILRSLDGGTHWEEMDFDETRTCFSIFGLEENDVWMGANQGIFHSTDMGVTWTEKLSLLGGSVNDIIALSTSQILATTTTGLILRSTNSGASWDTTYMAGNQMRSLTKIDNQRLMATGYSGLIIKSVDQGDTWTTITPPEANLQYEQTQFLGEEGWMVTSSFKKVMWHSDNAGDTWAPIDLPIERFWEGVYFITPDTGIIAGRNNLEGRVYITYDGGVSWQGGHITSFPINGVTGLPNPNGTAWIYGFGSNIEVLPYCNALPIIQDLAGDFAPCEGDTVLYSVTSQDVAQYFWLFPNGWNPIGVTNNDSVWVVIGNNKGTVSVTGSNPCGISETINKNIDPNLLPTVSNFMGEGSPCEGSSVTYSVTGNFADQYVWSFPIGWNAISDPTLASVMVDVSEMSGVVSVLAINTCGASQQLVQSITTQLLPTVLSLAGESAPCQGTEITYTADALNADEVVWSLPGDWDVVGLQNQSSIQLVVGATNGIIGAIAQNACGLSGQEIINVDPMLAPEVAIIQNGNNLSLSQTGESYQWYLNGEIIGGATGSEHIATVTGTYHATVVYPNGCEVSSDPANIIVTSIWNTENILPLQTFPNPADNEIYIQGIEGDFDYKIFGITGSMALTRNSTALTIPVGSLTEGVYVLRIQQGVKIYQTRFVIIR